MSTIEHSGAVGAEVHATKEAPNIAKNGGLQEWNSGTTVQPDDFTDVGTPDILRVAGERDNWNDTPFAVRYTATGAANEGGSQTYSNLKPDTKYGIVIRARATAGDTARIFTTGASVEVDTETISTTYVDLTGTFTTDSTPTDVVLSLVAKGTGDIVWFAKIMVVEGNVLPTFAPRFDATSINNVTAAANLTDNALVRGDGGAKGIQTSGILIDDSDNITGVNDLSVGNDLLVSGIATLQNTGLRILDTDDSHVLIIAPGSNLTADKTLTLATGDADRTITLSGDPTLSDWFNQSVKTTAAPEFAPASNAITIQNTTDFSSNQVAIFKSGNRGTPADGDNGYVSLYNDDSTGTQVEFSRISWVATDVTNTTKDGRLTLSTMVDNGLTAGMSVVGQSIGVGTLVPGVDLAGSTGDLTGNYFHIKNTTNAAGLIVEGTSGGATLNLIDLGAGANQRFLQLTVDGGIGKWRGLQSDSSTVQHDNIFVMSLGTGNVGAGTDAPGVDLAGDTSDFLSDQLFHIKGTSIVDARLIIEGGQPHLDMINLGAGANLKWLRLSVGSGVATWSSINDDGTEKTGDILQIGIGGDGVGVAGAVQVGGTLTLDSGSIVDSSGAISFGNENLSTTGSMGVGVIPLNKFHVEGSVSGDFLTLLKNTNANGWGLRIQAGSDNTDNALLVEDKDGGDLFRVFSGGNAVFSGNVGLGVTPSGAKLHLEGAATADARIKLVQTTAGLTGVIQQGSSGLSIDANGVQSISLVTNGSNGIVLSSSGQVFMPFVFSDVISGSVNDLEIKSDGQLGIQISSMKYKKNIRRGIEAAIDTSWLHDIEMTKWDSKDGILKDEISPIAEEMVIVNRKMVGFKAIKGVVQKDGKDVYYDTGEPETIVKSRLIYPILNEVQKLRRDLNAHINA